uniref:CCHC-type domain-containing protein n=1 Tax=Neolamprologus brichardi TaxID=32507 RepID=A0A3Q4G249_NEOBR
PGPDIPPPSAPSQLPAPEPSTPPTPASAEPPERALPSPEPFAGEFHKCAGFLTQITLQFRQLRRTYESDGHIPLPGPAIPPPSAPSQPPAPEHSTPPTPASAEPPERALPSPEPFAGECHKCAGFLTQITLQFRQLRRTYESDGAKIAFFVQLLRGQALNWAQAVLRNNPEIAYADFLSKFKSVFERGTGAEPASQRLLNLKQGRRCMADFWTMAEETGWRQPALISTLLNNVCDELKGELLMRELPKTLSEVITLCVNVDEHLRARRRTSNYSSQRPVGQVETASDGSGSSDWDADRGDEHEQPMQIGRSQISPEERARRWRTGECFYCGRKGHIAIVCPVRCVSNSFSGGSPAPL